MRISAVTNQQNNSNTKFGRRGMLPNPTTEVVNNTNVNGLILFAQKELKAFCENAKCFLEYLKQFINM